MIEVNLHPSGEKKRRKKGRGLSDVGFEMPDFGDVQLLESIRSDPWNAALIACLVVVPLAVGALWYDQRSDEEALQTRLDEALADSARLAELRTLSDSLTARRADIRSRIDLVRGLDGNRYVWPHLLDDIASALPPRAWIRAVKRQGEMPELQVQVLGTAATPLIITDFVRNLEATPSVGEVDIVGSNKQMQGGVSTQAFTLNLRYTPPTSGSVRTVPVVAGGE